MICNDATQGNMSMSTIGENGINTWWDGQAIAINQKDLTHPLLFYPTSPLSHATCCHIMLNDYSIVQSTCHINI